MKIELTQQKKQIIKQAQEALQAAETRYNTVLETLAAVTVLESGETATGWILDSDLNLVKPDVPTPESGIIES